MTQLCQHWDKFVQGTALLFLKELSCLVFFFKEISATSSLQVTLEIEMLQASVL